MRIYIYIYGFSMIMGSQGATNWVSQSHDSYWINYKVGWLEKTDLLMPYREYWMDIEINWWWWFFCRHKHVFYSEFRILSRCWWVQWHVYLEVAKILLIQESFWRFSIFGEDFWKRPHAVTDWSITVWLRTCSSALWSCLLVPLMGSSVNRIPRFI